MLRVAYFIYNAIIVFVYFSIKTAFYVKSVSCGALGNMEIHNYLGAVYKDPQLSSR